MPGPLFRCKSNVPNKISTSNFYPKYLVQVTIKRDHMELVPVILKGLCGIHLSNGHTLLIMEVTQNEENKVKAIYSDAAIYKYDN